MCKYFDSNLSEDVKEYTKHLIEDQKLRLAQVVSLKDFQLVVKDLKTGSSVVVKNHDNDRVSVGDVILYKVYHHEDGESEKFYNRTVIGNYAKYTGADLSALPILSDDFKKYFDLI